MDQNSPAMPVEIFLERWGWLRKCPSQRQNLRLAEARNHFLFMNANPFRLDDPQPPLRKLIFKNAQRGSQQSEYVLNTLCVGAQYPDAMVTCRRINADIGEIEIERNENSFLCLGCVKHSWIGMASQLFGQRGMHVVTRLPKEDLSITRKIFVEFEAGRHPALKRGWERSVLLLSPRHSRSLRECAQAEAKGIDRECGQEFHLRQDCQELPIPVFACLESTRRHA